ncbi:hypothetical protein H6P81_016064 [Aristolochia fimbriata]|uniref:Uncharacterized protein n=1 Tax=Aristolochia fimbriata TaxID=158543 RepID=A0AAV7E7M6_ARIFI|nr:hypothetical protein H6P81_016064 [Aristolochia fimbriata]
MIGRADIEGSKSNAAMNAWLPQAAYPRDVPPQPNSPPDNVFRRIGSPRRSLEQKGGAMPAPTKRNNSEVACSAPGKAPKGAFPDPIPGRASRTTRSRPRGAARAVHRQPTGSGLGPRAQPSSQSFSGYGSILPTSIAYIVPSTKGCSPWRPDAVMSTTRRGRHSVLRIFKGRRAHRHHATRRRGALPAVGPYLRLSRFQVGRLLNRKDNSSPRPRPASPDSPNALPTATPASGSTNPCTSAVHMEPFPSSPFKFSFEYLLLPPRSAPTAAPPGLGAEVLCGSRQPPILLIEAWLLPRRRSGERFARQDRCGPPPEVSSGPPGHSSPSFGSRQPARWIPPISFPLRLYGFGRPLTSHTCQTPWSVFQGGSNGEPADRHQERAGATRARPREGVAPPSSVRRGSVSAGRDHPPGAWSPVTHVGTCSLSVSRRYLALGGIYRPIWAAFPNNPTSPTTPQRSRRGPGTTGQSPSLAPHSMGLAPGPSRGALLRLHQRRKAARFSSWALPGSLRPLLGESLVTIRARPPVTEATAGRGPLQSQGLGHDLSPRGRGGGGTTSSCRAPLGQSVFSQPRPGGKDDQSARPRRPAEPPAVGQQGTGWGENTSGVTPRQVTVFEVGRHGHAAGDRLALPLSLGTDHAEWLFVCSRPGPSRAADAEPVGAGREREARGFDGRFSPGRAPVAAGHRVQLVRLGRARFVESTMILPQRRTANVAAIRTLHRTIQSVGATGGVYKGQGRSQRRS